MSDVKIAVKGLVKEFGAFTAVDNIDFEVRKGEVLGFLGPNGAGKSTTMKMITGFLAPTSGEITVGGLSVDEHPVKVKRSIGYLPEGAPAYGDMTTTEFLGFIADIRGYTGDEKQQRIQTAIDKANLGSVVHKTIDTLSKGFKRRVGLAQAILHDPPILIMDEPTDGLDPNQKHEVRELIRDMARDKAILISTHILEEVNAICDRVIIIALGRIVFDGTPQALEAMSNLHNSVRITFSDVIPGDAEEYFRNMDDVVNVICENKCLTVIPDNGVSIINLVAQQVRNEAWDIEELFVMAGQLDEVFRTITTQPMSKRSTSERGESLS